MDVGDLTGPGAIMIAALAGAVSFLSPCVAPLLPGYVAFLAGGNPAATAAAGAAGRADAPAAPRVAPDRAIGFAIGFVAIFVALGATAAAVSRSLLAAQDVLELVGGLLVALVGVAMLSGRDLLPARAEAAASGASGRTVARLRSPANAVASAGVGAAFAVAWTPCTGPLLASILLMAGGSGDPAWGALLLGAYAVGLVLPLVAAGVALGRTRRAVEWLVRHRRTVDRIAGVLLVIVGLAIATGLFAVLAGRLSGLVPGWVP